METVFIADDEKIIREGLRCIMDWDSLGFQICGESNNGEDALSQIISLNPSLVLLDIRMPKLSGIDLVKAAREKGYAGHFIILSGYSDFSYAQKAITYGVDNYLTKPIDEDELLDAVTQVKQLIEKEISNSSTMINLKKKAKNVILHELIMGNSDLTPTNIKELQLEASIYQVVLYESYSQEISDLTYNFADLLKVTNKGNNSFEHFKENKKDILILKDTFALEKFQNFVNHYETNPQKGSPLDTLFLVYGRPVSSLSDISLSYQDAFYLINRRFFCEQGQHTLGYEQLPSIEQNREEINPDFILTCTNYLTGYLQTFNRKKVVETLFSLEEYLYNVKNEIFEVKLFLTDLFLQIKEKMNHTYNTLNIPFPTNSSIIEFIEKKNYLYEIILFFSEQFEMVMNATGNPSRDTVLDDIIYYIEHNYTNNIKLETIAPLFGYNSAYLGKIFNKALGESFNSYVDHMRINHSKELLLQNKLKVYEIAEQVGYKNVDYFHKKFKKYVGESPAEFRKKLDLDLE